MNKLIILVIAVRGAEALQPCARGWLRARSISLLQRRAGLILPGDDDFEGLLVGQEEAASEPGVWYFNACLCVACIERVTQQSF